MRKKLIVSEVAKLLEVSPHTIRYYDKEGLVSSDYDAASGYRLFDMTDVAKLSNVFMLRESGIPIKEIKRLVQSYSIASYRQQLGVSLQHLEEKQRKLNIQKNIVKKALESIDCEDDSYEIKYYKTRFLRQLILKPYEYDISPLEMYEVLKSEKVKNVMCLDMVYELREEGMIIAFETEAETDIFLKAGKYIEYQFTFSDEVEVTNATMKITEIANEEQFKLEDKIYLRIQPHAMLVVDQGYRATLFCKIESNDNEKL